MTPAERIEEIRKNIGGKCQCGPYQTCVYCKYVPWICDVEFLLSELHRMREALRQVEGFTSPITNNTEFKPPCERNPKRDYHDCFCDCIIEECNKIARQALRGATTTEGK